LTAINFHKFIFFSKLPISSIFFSFSTLLVPLYMTIEVLKQVLRNSIYIMNLIENIM